MREHGRFGIDAGTGRAADLSVAPIYKAAPPPWRPGPVPMSGSRAAAPGGARSFITAPPASTRPRVRSQWRDRGRHHRAPGPERQLGGRLRGRQLDHEQKGKCVRVPPNAGFSNEVRERWLSTFRGRVGVTQNNWLFYATAGGALASVEQSITSPAGARDRDKNWHWGWTAGAGVEVKISHDWSAKMEYLYVALQDKAYFNPAPAPTSRAISRCGSRITWFASG